MKRICENPELKRKLGLTEGGVLCVFRDGEWADIPFNDVYTGEFPPCAFKDILYAREFFYAAATTSDGMAAVYTSETGGQWDDVNLKEQHFWADGKPPKGCAVRLFYEPCMQQILLVCSGGDVVIIPICPKCVKILRVTDKTVADADYSDHQLALTYEDGQTETIHLTTEDVIRVSLTYARQTGGELIDIRPEAIRQLEGPIPCTVSMDPEDLDDYLEAKAPDTRMYFICSFGTVADQAAWHAYFAGFENARSVGGIRKGLHID